MQAEFRYAGVGIGRALAAVAFIFTGIFLYSSIEGGVNVKELLAGGPLFFLLCYGALLFLVNRREVSVSPDKVTVRHRPLWAGVGDWSLDRSDIARAYWRLIVVVQRYSSETHYYAGAEMKSGEWKDLLGPYDREQDARQMAIELGELWQSQVVQHGLIPPKRDWSHAKVVLLWGGAFILALINGALAEVYYSSLIGSR